MLQSRSKLHTRDDGKRDRERDGDRCSVLVGDDIPKKFALSDPVPILTRVRGHGSSRPGEAPVTPAIGPQEGWFVTMRLLEFVHRRTRG